MTTDQPSGLDAQMSEALAGMRQHRTESLAIDRRGWTTRQWADDAERLMGDLDGSVHSLLNGHVTGLVAERREAEAAIRRARELADITGWHVYQSRDTGDVYPAESVQDLMADIRAALDGSET